MRRSVTLNLGSIQQWHPKQTCDITYGQQRLRSASTTVQSNQSQHWQHEASTTPSAIQNTLRWYCLMFCDLMGQSTLSRQFHAGQLTFPHYSSVGLELLSSLTLMHSEWPKLHWVLTILSAIGLINQLWAHIFPCNWQLPFLCQQDRRKWQKKIISWSNTTEVKWWGWNLNLPPFDLLSNTLPTGFWSLAYLWFLSDMLAISSLVGKLQWQVSLWPFSYMTKNSTYFLYDDINEYVTGFQNPFNR